MEFEEQIEPELNVQNDYYERLESLSEWIDTIEELIDSAKNADNYQLFKEAEECFQVAHSPIYQSFMHLLNYPFSNSFIQECIY